MIENHRPLSDVAQRGQALYDAQIREKVETEHRNKFLVVDVNTGDYEIDSVAVAAMQKAKEKNPNGVFYLIRIGHRTAYHMGGWRQAT